MKNIQFINAGAGSGKTYTLTQTLSEDVKAGKYDAGEVLLTTFTRKAAEEIKLKARTRLLQDGLSHEALKLDGAFMGTVHSVGYQFMNKYWYLLGLSPNIREMAEEDVESYFKSAIANIPTPEDMDALNHFNRRFDFQGSGFNGGSDPFKWQKHVKGIIDMAITNRISDLSDDSVSYKASVDWFKTMFPLDGRSLSFSEKELREKIVHLTRKVLELPDARNKGRKNTAKEIESSVRYAISFNDLWKAVDLAADVSDKIDDPEIDKFVNRYAGFYLSPAFQAEVEGYIKLIFKLAANSLQEFEDYKKKHGLVDFNDMESMFLELLSMEEVREDISSSVKIVMVDEFQDSNPVQLAIFLTLSDIVERSIWVGDPKQAIYGFRGTDPLLVSGVFKKIASSDVGNNLKARLLKRSWRSRSDLVKMVNQLFEEALAPQLSPIRINKSDVLGYDEKGTASELAAWVSDTFEDDESVALSPRKTVSLIPVREDHKQEMTENALIHWHFNNPPQKGGGNINDWVNYLSGALRDWLQEGHWIIDKTSGEKRKVRPGDVAVLCRSNVDVVKVSQQLRDLGLEVSSETEGLSDTVEYRILMDVLQLLVNPYDSLAVSELMLLFPMTDSFKSVEQLLNDRIEFAGKAPEVEGRWEYLKNWGQDNPVFARIAGIRETGMHLSVKDLIQKAIVDMDLYGHLVSFGDEDQRRANLQAIIRYADLYNDHCLRMSEGESISGFLDYLESSDAFNKQAASNSPKAVNVLTYHKSKGLEWPVVLMFDLNSDYTRNFHSKHLFKTTINSMAGTSVEKPLDNRFIRFGFWPFGSKKSLGGHDDLVRETDFYKETEQKVREEELRLLYVGMTRARDYLITTTFNKKESKWLKLMLPEGPEKKCQPLTSGRQTMDLFDCGVDVSVTSHSFELSGPAYFPDDDGSESTGVWFEKAGAKPQVSPLYLSPSKIDSGDEVNVNIVKNMDYRLVVNGRMENSTLGTLVHNALFLMGKKNVRIGIENLVNRNGAEGILSSDDLSEMVSRAALFVEEFKPVKIHRELFMAVKQEDGHVLRGEADLVLERENDLVLIDYKTYQGGKEQFLDPQGEFYAGKYAGQLNAYREMAEATFKKPVTRKLIFYVMQGAVVELT
ncbi:exodeoxyribonuclease V subunit beta [Marinilabilia salmonicolor]|uniref:DNA 3'-5' helicase n=1 Tax=Marinilabilia salmonicolor TaxID=989 RepID=A0A368V8V5_9BACT|nr:UvrD-helicase domain-containing protein [Marinilabilia salmonicolor]RCW36760.1 ATP-dependent exoDNAse (exonuclease V) beta subunit [Marinilabilia salmonicolor]